MNMQTCLTCEHLSEPESPHKWHSCTYPMKRPKVPAVYSLWSAGKDQIDIKKPHEDCPCWKERK